MLWYSTKIQSMMLQEFIVIRSPISHLRNFSNEEVAKLNMGTHHYIILTAKNWSIPEIKALVIYSLNISYDRAPRPTLVFEDISLNITKVGYWGLLTHYRVPDYSHQFIVYQRITIITVWYLNFIQEHCLRTSSPSLFILYFLLFFFFT